LNPGAGIGEAFELMDIPGAMPMTPDAAIDQALSTLSPDQLNGSGLGFGAAFDLADIPGAMPGSLPPGAFAPPLSATPPAIAGPIATPSSSSPVVSRPPHPAAPQPPSPLGGEGSIPTVQPPEPLTEDEIAAQAGFGYTGLPVDRTMAANVGFGALGAPPMARGWSAPFGWDDVGRAVMGGLFAGPVGAIAAPLVARGIGSIQNAISAPRPPSFPTHAVLDGMGNIIRFGGGGFDGSGYGGAGFGGAGGAFSGAANDAFGFSGGVPGMGHYGGPNPGPNDPDYGYA
jgi:hypothetical protein